MWGITLTTITSMSDELLQVLTARDLAQRQMMHDDPVIQRALALVGQPLNPVRVVGVPEIEAIYQESEPGAVGSEGARKRLGFVKGFRRPGDHDRKDPNIYINKDNPAYKDARNAKNEWANLALAAILTHEQIHNTESGAEGERAARIKEADFIRSKMDRLSRGGKEHAKERLRYLDTFLAPVARPPASK